MRYEKLLTQLEKARTTYENTVRELITQAHREDIQIAEAVRGKNFKFFPDGSLVVRGDPEGRAAKKAAWTPARRRKQSLIMKKRRAAEKRGK